MKKTVVTVMLLTGFVAVSPATLIMNEQFNYSNGANIKTVSGWSGTGSGTVSNGVLTLGGDLALLLPATYTVDPGETGANHQVSELWFKATVQLGLNASIRPGLGSTTSSIALSKYDAVQLTMASGNLSLLRVWTQNWYGDAAPVPSYDGSGFVDVYGKVSNSADNKQKVEIWFNPSNPANLGTATVTYTKAYVDSKIIDRIDLSNWGGTVKVDSITVGTQSTDVIPEPATLSLFTISGIGCLLARRILKS